MWTGEWLGLKFRKLVCMPLLTRLEAADVHNHVALHLSLSSSQRAVPISDISRKEEEEGKKVKYIEGRPNPSTNFLNYSLLSFSSKSIL